MVAHGLMVKNFENLFRSGRWNDGNWITLRIGITGTQSGQTLSCTDLWISGWWFNILFFQNGIRLPTDFGIFLRLKASSWVVADRERTSHGYHQSFSS